MDQAGTKRRNEKTYYGRTAKKGAVWSIIRDTGHLLIAVPTSMIVARVLSPSDFGIAAAASFFVAMAVRLTQFGFNAAIVRIKELRTEHLSSVFMVNMLTGVVTYTVLVMAAPWIGAFFRSPEAGSLIAVTAVTFLITPFAAVPSALISRRMQFHYSAWGEWTDLAVGSVLTLVFALLGWGYWSIAYGHVFSVVARVALLLRLSRWWPTLQFSRAALRELLSFGLGVQTKRLMQYASDNVDNLVVGRLLGVTSLGFYEKAFNTMTRVVARLKMGQAPFRIFSIIHADGPRFRRAYSRLILGVTVLAYPAFAAMIVTAEPFFVVLYGSKWLPAVLPFQLLCLGGILRLLNEYASQANEAAGGIWAQARRQAVGTVLVVIGASAGSLYGGIAGAAFGVALAMAAVTVLMQTLLRQVTALSWRALVAPHVPGTVGAIALSGVMLATDAALRAAAPDAAALVRLAVAWATGALFYSAFLLFSPFGEVRDLVRETVDDLAPARAIVLFNRLSRLGRAAGTP